MRESSTEKKKKEKKNQKNLLLALLLASFYKKKKLYFRRLSLFFLFCSFSALFFSLARNCRNDTFDYFHQRLRKRNLLQNWNCHFQTYIIQYTEKVEIECNFQKVSFATFLTRAEMHKRKLREKLKGRAALEIGKASKGKFSPGMNVGCFADVERARNNHLGKGG